MVDKNTIKVNDLIFRELIKRGYSLEGNTRIWNIADSKLWYLTPKQAQSYLDLEADEAYQKEVIQQEIDLINEYLPEITEELKDKQVNILDLGCGDGKKARMFISSLKGKTKMRYCPVDISSYMVEKALENIRKSDVEEVVKFQWNISDFENMENVSNLLRYGNFQKTMTLLLGNTLGNFEINELLYEIRSSMKDGDILIIGNGLDNRHPDEILKAYGNKEVDNFLKHIPLQLGLEKEDITLGVRFKHSRVELYYTINKNKTIEFQNKKVVFNEGDQILVSISYKYTKEDFTAFLKMYFGETEIRTSPDNSYALAICKK